MGVLLYLTGHTGPNIAYAANYFNLYMFALNHFHRLLLKNIGRYLKGTMKKGLGFNPSSFM